MLKLTKEQYTKALTYLAFWHIVVIAASNYLVQFPFEIGPIKNTWGAFTFPFIFLTTDLTVRIFGQSLARKIIFVVMFPALIISYFISVIFHDGAWAGFSGIATFDVMVFRIALASFGGYIVGQIMDITVFNRLRKKKSWWLAPAASTVFGSLVDTIVFFSIAFFHSTDPYMAEHWVAIASADYAVKLMISTLFFLPAYGILLNILIKKLITIDPEDKKELVSGANPVFVENEER